MLSPQSPRSPRAAIAAKGVVRPAAARFHNGVDRYVNVSTAQNAFLTAREAEPAEMRQIDGESSRCRTGAEYDGERGASLAKRKHGTMRVPPRGATDRQ
jgi:hypothetical protein